ncbi:hypothetical protein LEP1GSC187_2692 [Leptospira santarosai str. ZUN179]|uniref:Uncharacterized protein n=3 Tax=Leptospira santarosai TaxID=28183 RepID=M6V359_9LEPT|nr:hypothetical protein LEP1GSC179_2553 [Leptospira santarosai str. MOR084]EMN21789.1 hypothetical protein LEP1GSC063_3723 [Leptospira santarosai serovar Arenal str. MAVJ 401]EMO43943.1 hypothetical protein LEP1GSC187_2692 [Leptospira santarosai str. ZUN179]
MVRVFGTRSKSAKTNFEKSGTRLFPLGQRSIKWGKSNEEIF